MFHVSSGWVVPRMKVLLILRRTENRTGGENIVKIGTLRESSSKRIGDCGFQPMLTSNSSPRLALANECQSLVRNTKKRLIRDVLRNVKMSVSTFLVVPRIPFAHRSLVRSRQHHIARHQFHIS